MADKAKISKEQIQRMFIAYASGYASAMLTSTGRNGWKNDAVLELMDIWDKGYKAFNSGGPEPDTYKTKLEKDNGYGTKSVVAIQPS